MTPGGFPEIAWAGLAPELLLVVGAVGLLLLDVQMKPGVRVLWGSALGVLAIALALAIWQWVATEPGGQEAFGGMLLLDPAASFARLVVLVVSILAVSSGRSLFAHLGGRAAEGVALVLLASAGFVLMAASQNLVMMFLGLEMGSISLYILAGITGDGVRSDEAALKYLLLGAVASAVFIYGVALVFAGTGSLGLGAIGWFLTNNVVLTPAVILIGIGLITVGLSFKVAAAPFHVWAPDVYQGAPAGIVGYMAAVAKVGGFAALARVLLAGFGTHRADWALVVAGIAALSMLVGAVMAIISTDIRRLLAYSGVAHAGFILTGLASGSQGAASVWFYLAVYTVQLVAAFSVISAVGGAASSGSDDIGLPGPLSPRSLPGDRSVGIAARHGRASPHQRVRGQAGCVPAGLAGRPGVVGGGGGAGVGDGHLPLSASNGDHVHACPRRPAAGEFRPAHLLGPGRGHRRHGGPGSVSPTPPQAGRVSGLPLREVSREKSLCFH